MRRLPRAGLRWLALGGLAVVGATAAPSKANAQTYYQFHSRGYVGYCIDAMSRNVIRTPCGAHIKTQQWERWQGGWMKNRATGACLSLAIGGPVYAVPCNANDLRQFWYHWHKGWLQRPRLYGEFSAQCLEARKTTYIVYHFNCSADSPTNPLPNRTWDVRQVY